MDAKQSGKLTGRTELALSLQSVRVDGRMVDVNTQTVSEVSDSRTGKTAKVAGGTAGSAMPSSAPSPAAARARRSARGRGRAAAGTGVQVVTAGQRVRIPSETRLTFVLDNPVRL